MAAVTAYLVRWAARPTASAGAVALFLIARMVTILPERFAWSLEPGWTFALLSAIFLAVETAAYTRVFPALPLTGGGWTALSNAASNGFWSGTISATFQKVGFFSLRVKEKRVC